MKSITTVFGLVGAAAGFLLVGESFGLPLPPPVKTALQVTAAASTGVIGKYAADQKDLDKKQDK